MKKIRTSKWMGMLVLLIAVVFTVSACSPGTEETNSTDTMDKETMDDKSMEDDNMSEESMEKDDMEHTDEDLPAEGDEDKSEDAMEDKESMDDEETMEKEDAMDDGMTKMTNEGDLAPNFEFTDLEGNELSLVDLQGQKVYLKYWASWCSICLAGLEELNELAGAENDYEVLTVVMPGTYGEMTKEDFIEWFNGLGYEHINVYFDEGASVGNELGIRAFPTSVFIGSDGVLISVEPGHKTNEYINDKIGDFY